MLVLSIALVIGAVVGAFVAGGAIDRAFPAEIAVVRGAVAFMAIAFVGYLGELIVVTAPRRERPAAKRPAADPVEDAAASVTTPEPPASQARPAPPRLAPVPVTDENSNADDADVDLRPAA